MRKFEDSLPLQLLKAREASMNFFRPLLLAHNLTEQQWRVMRALENYGELESKQLAQHCCILSPSMTGIIKRLEQMGYIARRKSDVDQRRTLISLTAASRQILAQLSPVVDARYQVLVERYGEQRVAALSELLTDLAELEL